MLAIGTWAEHIPCSMSSSKDSKRPPAELETRVCEMCFPGTQFKPLRRLHQLKNSKSVVNALFNIWIR